MNRVLTSIFLCLICLGASAQTKQKIQRYDDKNRPVIAAKGNWSVGGSALYSCHSNANFTLGVVKDINSVGYRLAVVPECCYYLADNLGLGLKLSYGQRMMDIATAKAEFGEVALSVKDYVTASQSMSATFFARYLIPIGDSNRFAFYADGGLKGTLSYGKDTDGHTGSEVGSWYRTWDAGIVLNPGFMAFITDSFALFASVGWLSLTAGNTYQIHNQVEEGSRNKSNFSCMVDLTAVGVGFDFYIGKK